MREILFRGKNLKDGGWEYGFYVKGEKSYIVKNVTDCKSVSRLYMYNDIEVDPNTIGQYTGLKDKNGKKIFEGDIVRCWGGIQHYGVWEHDSKLTINNMINDCFMMGENEFLEVIGNIHESKTE